MHTLQHDGGSSSSLINIITIFITIIIMTMGIWC